MIKADADNVFHMNDLVGEAFNSNDMKENPRNPFQAPFGLPFAVLDSCSCKSAHQLHWHMLEHYGYSQNNPIRHEFERGGLGDGDPWAIQVLKNSAKFRAKTGFAPGNHRMYQDFLWNY